MRQKKVMLMHMKLALVAISALTAIKVLGAGTSAQLALPGCTDTCGDIAIPYPFGIGASSSTGQNCFLQKDLELVCDDKFVLRRIGGTVPILNISLDGKIDLLALNSTVCRDESDGSSRTEGEENTLHVITRAFSISEEDNKFISVGCDTYGYLNNFYKGTNYSTGCLTRCNSIQDMKTMQTDGNCTGIGCCQVDIPLAMKNLSIKAYSFNNFNYSKEFNNCSYSFIAKKGSYNFSLSHLQKMPLLERLPMVVDWTVGNESCEVFKGRHDYACRNNSGCENSITGYGYRCRCEEGFEGNPYHPYGCRDIEECKNENSHNCISIDHCRETNGSFECFCPVGKGDGKREGKGCQLENILIKVVIGVVVGLAMLIMGISWLYLIYHKRKLIKLKEKFFQQNGGILLQQQLSTRKDSSQFAKIFTEEQLIKATNNYDESLIIGKGGFGTVFKGVLSDNQIVAIKKSKVIDKSQSEQFINEVIVLSQINHRNVVKLLGCCLETEVPLLVYEFISNGTLFEYLHNEGKKNVSWKTRLQIGLEAAGALSYLHSSASIPIIHRDIKSANVLLDDKYTAKVSDFGISRLVPIDQVEMATMVQGTLGYLDPEYLQTNQLNEKSDVYSFGVVLVELLTGEKALSFERPEEKRSLAKYFISCLENDQLFDVLQSGILDRENEEPIKEVAMLAAKCLRLQGEKRPSMKEVEMELKGIRVMEKHPWIDTNLINLEETQHLLSDTSRTFEHGNTSSSNQNIEYDSLRDHVLIAFDNGR